MKPNMRDMLSRWPQLNYKQRWLLELPGHLQEELTKLLPLRTIYHTGGEVRNVCFFLSLSLSHWLSFIPPRILIHHTYRLYGLVPPGSWKARASVFHSSPFSSASFLLPSQYYMWGPSVCGSQIATGAVAL